MTLLTSIYNFLKGSFCTDGIQHDNQYHHRLQQQRARHAASRSTASNRNVRTDDYRSSTSSFETNNYRDERNRQTLFSSEIPRDRGIDGNLQCKFDLTSTRIGGKISHPPSTNSSSAQTIQETDPILAKWKSKWNAKMQIDNFISSTARNLPQIYQDSLDRIVRNCHQAIENHLRPHWSSTLTRYNRITVEERGRRSSFDSAYGQEVKVRCLEKEALISWLEVYAMQKVNFDDAIISYFNQIVNQYEDSHQDGDIDLDNNQAIQVVMDKINLEIKRLCMRLPIYANRHQIQQQINNNQITIIKGQTGSGKSTQIPQYIAELNIGNVICSQPTKIAAIGLANHLNQEYAQMASSIDNIIDYNTRHPKSHSDSIITFATDSILLDILVNDPILSSYGCVIVDEAHRRSLYTDILLAFLKQALTRRRDLKLIIISANVDTKRFTHYFNNCPTISISGKLFPVDIKWCNNSNYISNYLDKALDTVVEIHNGGEKGDILVFLTTPDETEKACAEIKKRFSTDPDSIIALSLHDRIQGKDLQDIFMTDLSRKRKVIFATNCAETSITIPEIRYVVDTGLIKDKMYNDQSNCHILNIHSICQSSAMQRCDCAGRSQSGICYRLYPQNVFDNMSRSSEPEIKCIDLSNVILKMIELGVADIINFDFIDSPSSQHIIDSLNTLHMLSAITSASSPLSLTSKGKLYCQLPLEPRLSALVINAKKWNMLTEGIIIAAALSIPGNLKCRHESEDKRDADKINAQFCCSDGDIISTAAVYMKWRSLYGRKEYKSWCYDNKINRKLMKHLDSKVHELQQSLTYLGIKQTRWKIPSQLKPQSRNNLRQLIFQCYYDRLAIFTGLDKLGYVTIYSDNQYLIHKSSALLSSEINPKFIVYQEIFTAWDDFLINITPVDEKWLQCIDDSDTDNKIENMLDNSIVTQTTDNLGSVILSEYDANSLDKMVKKLLKDESIRSSIIKNLKGSNLEITTIKSKMPRLLDFINQSITQKKEKLIKAVKILSKEDHINACRLIISRGIIVKDILLPSDCIEFKITLRYTGYGSPSEESATNAINEVRALITSCGELAFDIDSNSINKSKDYKYIRFDKILYQQTNSQSLLKGIDRKVISRYEVNIESASWANCRMSMERTVVQFRLPRWPRNGNVSITCRDHTVAMNIQNDFPLTIRNQKIFASIDRRSASKLFLRQIPNCISADDIRMAVPFTNREAITDIYFHRVATSTDDEISTSNLESILRRVLNNNGFLGKYSDVKVRLMSPIKKSAYVYADAIFYTCDDAVSAIDSLNGKIYKELIDEPISARLNRSRIIKCQPEIYACVARELDRLRETLQSIPGDQEKFVHVNIYPSNKKYQLTSIVIRSSSELSLNEIVHRIGIIIQPERIPIDAIEMLEYLNTNDRKSILTFLSHRFTVHTKIDWKSQCILIYGEKSEREQALQYCQKEINQLRSKYNIIELVGNNKPKGLIKVIIKRYGIKFNTLLQSSKADVIRLNKKNKTLIVIGEKHSFAYILNQINLCCNSLQVSKEKSNDEILSNECVVCFCEVDNNSYRLQYCGHLYCQDCIRDQMNSAIRSSSFPLNCASCNKGFVIQDLEQLLAKLPQPRLFDVLLTEFIRRHPKVWHYCPTPGCESVYKRSGGYQVFTCPECQKKTCRGCDTEDHPGYNCNEIKLYRENPNASFEKYLSKNSKNVKKCPKCNAAIEKLFGCNHMECGFCHTHFCWLCLAGYQTSLECYQHLQERHGSYA